MSIDNIIDSFIINGTERELDSIILNGVEYLLAGSSGTRYSITWNLTHITPSPNRSFVVENNPLQVTLTADSGYEIESESVIIMMGGVDITDSVYSNGVINIPSVTNNVLVSASAKKAPIDLLNVTWADHAVTCGQSTNAYNAWSPHNFQYDDVHECFVFLQCHCDKHLNHTYTNWTLSIINPYDPNDYENITIPTFNGLGMLFVENGVWTLMPREGTELYRSNNKGVTWETISATIPSRLFGVYKCGDTYLAGNDSNTEITYYKSSDLINWETISFDSSLGYSILCETSFCEYGGKWWAFNRTNDSELGHPVILQSTDEGDTWTLFSDQELHGYRSTVSCYPFKNYIVVADIDRDGGYIYYNKFDGSQFVELNSWKIPFPADDFHNINIASNYEDTVVLEFMHAVSGTDITGGSANTYYAQRACDNVMLVGSTKELPSLTFNYIDTMDDLVTYLNENSITGLNSQRTYSWAKYGNNNLRINFGESVSGFVDEIEIPLNFIQMNAGTRLDFTIKYGASYAKAWNNQITAPYKDNYSSTVNGTIKQGFVFIGGVRYVYGYNRINCLPVLTRVPYNVTINSFTPSSTDNALIGETWQENLGFRRVYSVNKSTNTASYLLPSVVNCFTGTEPHKFASLTYVPVNES